jgi:pimeloyl-ACP methyl ester carboxylesterase
MSNKTILFVHGMYMNGSSWSPWIEMAESRGYRAIAPSWPFHNETPDHLRNNIDPALGHMTFKHVVDSYKKVIDSLPDKPFLVGHSVGGLVVQKLINDGYGAAAVSISPAPPLGVFTLAPEFVKANLPHLNYFKATKPVIMTKKRFHYAFCNTMTRTESDAAFEQYVTPESRRVPQSILTPQGKVNFKKTHAPLLLIGGDKDNLIPLKLVRRNVKAYRKSEGVVDFQAFANRSHFICNQLGWEEVATASLDWIARHD